MDRKARFLEGVRWTVDPHGEKWRNECRRAAAGEHISYRQRGKLVAGLVPIADYEWLEANHPVVLERRPVSAYLVDGVAMVHDLPYAVPIRQAAYGKRTPVVSKNQPIATVAVVSPADLVLLEGRGVS